MTIIHKKNGKIMHSTIFVEKISLNDLYNFLLIHNKDFYPPLDSLVNILDYSKKLKEKANFFIALNNNDTVGLCAYYANNLKFAFLSCIIVDHFHQGCGIGTKLMTRMIDKNKNKNIKLKVYKKNSEAINLYTKFGFKKIENDNSFISMEKYYQSVK